MQRGAGVAIGAQVCVQIGRERLGREHGVDLQPDLPAVDGGCTHVIGTDRSKGDQRASVFGQRLAQKEFQLADHQRRSPKRLFAGYMLNHPGDAGRHPA